LDSTVLLHALAALRDRLSAPVSAIHVDHALHPHSAQWVRHCRRECEQLSVPFTGLLVDAEPAVGESPEAAARTARYAAIATAIGPGAMLLTAHHLDDQAETLLLQLMRGAGVDGLAAMPAVRTWGGGWHARPLLGWRRADLQRWALARRLHWADDPSNAETRADRNYLRHRILPALSSRWPAAAESIVRSAALCADASQILLEQAREDLAHVQATDGQRLVTGPLRRLTRSRARNVLRLWLRERGAPPLPWRRLDEALQQLLEARVDARVRIAWDTWQLRRFRGEIWLMSGSVGEPPAQPLEWSEDTLPLGPGLGRLSRRRGAGGIDPGRWESGRVQIGFRHRGLRCRPAGRVGTRPFKKIAQDCCIPPWLRPITPIVLIDGQPAAIANCCVCEPFAVGPGEEGWVVEWLPD
jgi:tRNA(Ile)-lysidine synthase